MITPGRGRCIAHPDRERDGAFYGDAFACDYCVELAIIGAAPSQAIVKRLAMVSEPTDMETGECLLCGAARRDDRPQPHRVDCPWAAARALVAGIAP